MANDLAPPDGTNPDARVIVERGSQAIFDRLNDLNDASRAIASTETLDDFLRVVTEAARTLIGCHQGVTSRLVDGWENASTHVSLSDKYAEFRDYDITPKGLGVLTYVTRENLPLRLTADELVAHPDWRGLRDAPGHPPLPDYLAAPLVSRHGVNIGLIQLSDKNDGSSFNEADERLLLQLAQMASATLEHVELLQRERGTMALLEEQSRAARLQAEVGIALTSEDSLDEKLHRCVKAMVDHFDVAFARIWICEGDVLNLRASAGIYTHLDGPHGQVPVGSFKIGRIAESREPHLTNDVAQDPNVSDPEWAAREGMVSFAGYPLVFENQCLGVVAAFSRRPMSESVLQALGSVSDVIGIGIERDRNARRMHEQSRQLRQLSEVALRVNAATEVDEVLQIVTESVRDIVGAHQSVSSLTRDDGWAQAITHFSLSEKYSQWRTGYENPPDGSGIYAWVVETQHPVRMSQAELEDHPRFKHFGADRDIHPPMRGWLAVPLSTSDGRSLGLIQLSDRYDGEFDDDDVAIVVQLAELASSALQRAVLFEERTKVAKALQASLLPPNLPELAGLEVAARYEPGAEEVGGDFYDVFPVLDTAWGVLIGDVRGKGPEAAATTALARHSTRTAAILRTRPRDVLAVVNDALVDEDETERFCTAAFLRLADAEARQSGKVQIDIASGGHPPLLVVRSAGTVEEIAPTGPLLGLWPDMTFEEASVVLAPGDAIVGYTDGITEARRNGEEFGVERLAQLLVSKADLSAREMADEIVSAATAWSDRRHPADDAAVVVLRAT